MSLFPTLPNKNSLGIWQQNIVNLCSSNFNHDWIIQGGPGTGKTLTSICLASELKSNRQDVLLLIYNKPLQQYLEYALSKTVYNCQVKTYIQWLTDYYQTVFDRGYPKKGKFDPIWDAIKNDFMNRATKPYSTVIIDECQDVPIELMQCLQYISGNIICFIDPDQALQPNKTRIDNLLNTLNLPRILQLGTYYRNTPQIRSVANLFVSNPTNSGATPIGNKPIMWDCRGSYSYMEDKMCSIITDNPTKSIGIICPSSRNNWIMNRIYNELSNRLNGIRTVEMHQALGKSQVDFASTSVKLFTYNTMKGLEFDIVLIPRIDQISTSANQIIDNNRLYVATTRANEELHCFCLNRNGGNPQKWINTMSLIRNNSNLFDWK